MVGFNSGKFNSRVIKKYLLPILVEDKDIEPIVVNKANQHVSFKLGDVQILDILNFLGGAITLTHSFRHTRQKRQRSFSPYEWFDDAEKLSFEDHLPPHESFYSKLHNCNPLEKEYLDQSVLVHTGLLQESAMQELRITLPPATGEQTYAYLVEIWEREKMRTFKDFLRW